MEGSYYDEDVLRTIHKSGARVLLIGRRALIVLGVPVMTADFDLWVAFEDVEKLNDAFHGIDHFPNHEPQVARERGRYVLENDHHVDVMVARAKSSPEGDALDFLSAWTRRQTIVALPGVEIFLPSIDDLILTKRWASRAKDIADIQLLERLKQER